MEVARATTEPLEVAPSLSLREEKNENAAGGGKREERGTKKKGKLRAGRVRGTAGGLGFDQSRAGLTLGFIRRLTTDRGSAPTEALGWTRGVHAEAGYYEIYLAIPFPSGVDSLRRSARI